MRGKKLIQKEQQRRKVIVTLPSDLWKRFRIRAIEEGLPASHLLEKALESFLRDTGSAGATKAGRIDRQSKEEEPLF